jgi:hypothetical protein
MDDLVEDVASEVQADTQFAPSDQEVVTPEQERPKPVDDLQEKNWRAARSKLEEQNYQIQLLRQELEAVRHRQSLEKQPEVDEEEQFTESERKLYREIKTLKGEITRTQQRTSESDIDRLRSRFKDFDDVMDPENIGYLKQNNPSLAKAVARLQDEPYEQGLAAYEAIKNTSWYREKNSNLEEKLKIEQNVKKPVSVQAVRKQGGALGDANRFAAGLTPELKKQLQQEMAQARKG